MRYFNTAGPINPKDHYFVSHRFNEAKLLELVNQKKYFILHAARQSGKTTSMRVFVDELNATKTFKALYINIEPAQVARGNVEVGMRAILSILRSNIELQWGKEETVIAYIDERVRTGSLLTAVYDVLAYQACFVDVIDRTLPITKEVIQRAKEALIKRCDTHIDVLIDRLQEARVRNIIDAIIGGQSDLKIFPSDDVQYVRDLGLIKHNDFDIANPIYQEIIPRALACTAEEQIRENSVFYQNTDGTLNVNKLLAKFTDFYRENSTTWLADFQYKESGPHLLLMAFLQRIVNGGGMIHREYALDRKRVDLLLSWGSQRIVIELKVNRGVNTEPDGLKQTAEYMDIANGTEGHLVIFDRDLTKNWDQKISLHTKQIGDKLITVWKL